MFVPCDPNFFWKYSVWISQGWIGGNGGARKCLVASSFMKNILLNIKLLFIVISVIVLILLEVISLRQVTTWVDLTLRSSNFKEAVQFASHLMEPFFDLT